MRLSARYLSHSFFDFIENTRLGATLFRLARLGLFALGILVIGKFASAQFLGLQFQDVLFMAIAGVVFLVVAWRWEIGIILILCTTSFIAFYDAIPTLSLYHFIPEIRILEHLRMTLGQGLMIYLLVLFTVSRDSGQAGRRLATPLVPAVLVFLLAMLVVSLTGVVFRGVHLPTMVETARSYSFYLMCLVILLCVRGRKELRILQRAFFVMSLIVAVLMHVQFALGERYRVFLGSTVRVETFGGFAGRVLPPGTELIWMILPFVIARIPIASPRVRRLLYAGLFVLLGGLLLTFTRSIWMGVLLSMAIMAVLGRGTIRMGIMRMSVVMGASVALLLLLLSLVSTERDNYMTPYIQRFTSVFKPETYAEGTSAGVRWEEIRAAWPKIVEHPWLGIGVGGAYRYVEDWDDVSKQQYLRAVGYIHNAYVFLLTQGGVVALGTCLIMYAIFFVRARKIYHSLENQEDRSIVMAAIGSMASLMLACVMQPSLWYPPGVPCIGVILGMVELVRYFAEREREQRHHWGSGQQAGVPA